MCAERDAREPQVNKIDKPGPRKPSVELNGEKMYKPS